jgi:ribosome-associated protein
MPTPGDEYIELQQFIKLADLARTGGEAKAMIQNGEVLVNGQVETRRRRKLYVGDVVTVAGEDYEVGWDDDE